jgi:hypothetical protein
MITVCYISKDRPSFLQKSLQSLFEQSLYPSNIIIVDASVHTESIADIVNYFNKQNLIDITLIHSTQGSRSKDRSLCRQYVKTDIMISTECDILYPKSLILDVHNYFMNNKSQVFLKTWIQKEKEDGTFEKIRKEHRSGYCSAFYTKDFDFVGGYNPFIVGWGYEDADFQNRMLNSGCKEFYLPITVTHMWHKSQENEDTNNKNKLISKITFWNGYQWCYHDAY